MDQTDELPYEAAMQPGQAPVVNVGDTTTSDIDSLLQQATTMANQGGPGAHADEAQTWLQQQMAGGGKPAGTVNDPNVLSYEDVKPVTATKEIPFEQAKPLGSNIKEAAKTPLSFPAWAAETAIGEGGKYAKHATEDIANLFGSAASYFKNFHQNHETFDPGNVTPQEKIAAKLMGMKSASTSSEIQDPNSPYYDPTTANRHGPIYKLTPEQRQALSDKSMEAWGFTPKEERERVEASARGDWKSLDVVGGVTTNSAMANIAERILNPQLTNTKKYYALQDTVKAMDAVAHPDKYDPAVVKESAAKIAAYKKELSTSDWQAVKDMWQGILQEPGKTVRSLAYGIVQDPELGLIPEAKVGSLALAPKIARAEEAATTASKLAKLARSVEGAAKTQPEIAASAAKSAQVYQRVAERAGLAKEAAKGAAGITDVASVMGSGAAINAEIAAQEQLKEHGYVRQGSLAAPAAAGAAFGAVASGVGKLFPEVEHGVAGVEKDIRDRVEGTVREAGPTTTTGVPDVNAGKKPGEPLSPNTPINKESHVPYYGGVDASGKVIHIDENTPSTLPIKNMDGKKVSIPVLKTVAYHESVEFPLMHMEGPIAPDTLSQLYTRIGKEGKIPQEVVDKLKAGKSLSYPEAHEIATLAENHLVRTLYKTDPKVYQDALRPYIKDVGKANKEATVSDIPPGLDTKPYDDMGHPEVLKGAGAKPFVDVAKKVTEAPLTHKVVGKVGKKVIEASGGALEQQRGRVEKALLATGTVAGVGTTAGAILAPPGQKKEGAVLGGSAGLLLSMNMMGDSIPSRGFGKQEGMFAGPKATTRDPFKEAVAEHMEKNGARPADIHIETGLHRAAGGKWVHELPDTSIAVKEDVLKKTSEREGGAPVSIGEALHHPALMKAYPSLMKNLKVRQRELGEGAGGYYDPSAHMITLNDPSYLRWLAKEVGDPSLLPEAVLAHETQHAISHLEGMPTGDSPQRYIHEFSQERDSLETRWENLRIQRAEALIAGNEEKVSKIDDLLNTIEHKLNTTYTPKSIEDEAWRRYNASAGEQQAVNVQTRLRMTPEERAASLPESTMTLPIEKQRIEYNEEGLNYHQIPLSEQLKKTGDSDEEGHLFGMVLPEDRLPNEQAIISRAKMGDQQAISTLYKKYMPRLERTLRSMMREAGPRLGIDSEDIASQAFMKATQALPDFKGDSAFYTWLYSIARNEALNAIGKGNRQVPTTSMFAGGSKVGPEGGSAMTAAEGGIESAGGSPIRPGVEAIASTHDTPEAMAAAQQASNMVRYAISKLPQDIREAVKMKDLVGMTEQEIADAQGVPVGTVKSRLSRGRDMLQQSIKKGHGAQFREQGGFATPEGLKKLAKISTLASVGATLGAMYLNPENKLQGAWAGAAIALVGGEVKWNRLFPSLKEMMAKDDRVNVNTLLDNYDAALATAERTTAQVQYRIDKLAPSKESQKKITYWLDGDRSVSLTPEEMQAALVARQFYDSLGQAAHQKGVLEDFLQNYVNHEWGDSARAKALQDQIASSFATNMSPKDRHALARKFLTLEQGKIAGLVPKTENINELIGIYSNSMSKAMANKTLLDALKVKVLDPTAGVKAVMPAGKAPYNFVPIAHPQLNGVRVHPSIAPSLDFLFHTTNRGVIVSAVEGLNTATKRMEVSLSLFHVKALIDAFLGANPLSHPIKNLVDIATSMAGKSAAHKEYLAGGPGDVTDLLLRNGLKINPRKGQLSDEDIKTGFYEALDGLQQFMDQVVPGSGKSLVLVKKANKISDKFIWENVHTGLKATTAMNAYERLSRAHAQELLKDPNYRMPSAEELAKQAASFTNDTFGGLNWRRLADDATTKIGRNLSLVLASPVGRRISQVMMFAPDWTYSTIRSFFKAVGEGSGFRGLLQPKTLADLHRQYLIRSSIIYLTLYNALNMAMSGHPIWDNKDPLTVDLGNGERMQANKHFMETPHMLTEPAKFAIGKLGIIPSEILEQALHKEYLTTGEMPEMKGGRLAHVAKRFLPFAGQSFQQQGTPEMLANLAGFPIYGKHGPRTPEEATALKRQKHQSAEKAKKTRRENKLRKMYGE